MEVKVIKRVFDIIELFSEDRQELSIKEISEELDLRSSTVHRLLSNLKSRGYIIQAENSKKYMLGMKFFELLKILRNRYTFDKRIFHYMNELSEKTGETINLAVLSGRDVIYIEKVESNQILKPVIDIGTKSPAHSTALGKVLLSELENEEIRKLYNEESLSTLTQNTINSIQKLIKEVEKVREKGYAMEKEEFSEGISCLAIPIKRGGVTIAAISLTAPTSRFTYSNVNKFIDELKSTIKRLNEESDYNI